MILFRWNVRMHRNCYWILFISRNQCSVEMKEECYDTPKMECKNVEKPVTKTKQEKECHNVTDKVYILFTYTFIFETL